MSEDEFELIKPALFDIGVHEFIETYVSPELWVRIPYNREPRLDDDLFHVIQSDPEWKTISLEWNMQRNFPAFHYAITDYGLVIYEKSFNTLLAFFKEDE